MLIRQTPEGKSHAPWMMALGCGAMAVAFAATVFVRDTRPRGSQAPVVRPSGRSDLWYGQRLRGT